MNRVELIKIEGIYDLFAGRSTTKAMLVLQPHLPFSKGRWKPGTYSVTLVTPVGLTLEATAEFAITHLNIRNPDIPVEMRYPIAIWLTDRTKDEVPIDTALLVDRDLYDALQVRK